MQIVHIRCMWSYATVQSTCLCHSSSFFFCAYSFSERKIRSLSTLGLRWRDRDLDFLVEARSILSRIGIVGMARASLSLVDKSFPSLLVRRVELIVPRSVRVPIAKTETVTAERSVSATMFDVNRLITYCWRYALLRYSWYIPTVNARITAA